MLDKEKPMEMVKNEVGDDKLRKHMYAVSAIMGELAEELDKDAEKWGKVGLLHDIDYERTKDEPENHALISAQMLEDELSEKYLDAIKAHNYQNTGVEPEKDIDNALIAADAISGLIVATALVMPNSKMEEARPESVLKKFDDSSFAKNIDREKILYCEKLGLDKEKFVEISLKALKKIDDKLGL